MAEEHKPLPAVRLLIDGCHGQYVPQRFVKNFDVVVWNGISLADVFILNAGPDDERYWETWDDVLSNATFTHGDNTWRLHQDGDLWAYCLELMDEDEKKNFGFDA